MTVLAQFEDRLCSADDKWKLTGEREALLVFVLQLCLLHDVWLLAVFVLHLSLLLLHIEM